jgi:hypothetical protein
MGSPRPVAWFLEASDRWLVCCGASHRSNPEHHSRFLNAQDRNSDGEPQDRPDIGNPSAPLNTRATLFTGCAETGYRNPDTNACVSTGDVHWVQRPKNSFPNATHGRPQTRFGRVASITSI